MVQLARVDTCEFQYVASKFVYILNFQIVKNLKKSFLKVVKLYNCEIVLRLKICQIITQFISVVCWKLICRDNIFCFRYSLSFTIFISFDRHFLDLESSLQEMFHL